MKRTILSLFLLFHFVNTTVSQQDSTKLFHAIKTYPFNFVNVQEFNIAYETNFDAKNGIEFLIGTSLKDHVFYTNVDINYLWKYDWNIDDIQPSNNVITRISYKRYFGKGNFAANKFYISPLLTFKYSFLNNIKYVDTYDGRYEARLDMHRNMIGFHFLIGQQKVLFDSPVLIGWFFGTGAKFTYYNKETRESWRYSSYSEEVIYSNEPRTESYFVLLLPTFYCGINLGVVLNKN